MIEKHETASLQRLLTQEDLHQLRDMIYPTGKNSVNVAAIGNTISFSSVGIYGIIKLTDDNHLESYDIIRLPITKITNFMRQRGVDIAEDS